MPELVLNAGASSVKLNLTSLPIVAGLLRDRQNTQLIAYPCLEPRDRPAAGASMKTNVATSAEREQNWLLGDGSGPTLGLKKARKPPQFSKG